MTRHGGAETRFMTRHGGAGTRYFMKKTTWMNLAGIGSLALFSASARADFFIHSWDNHHTEAKLFDVGANLIWYRTTTNFDSNGSTFTPTGLNSYQRVLLDLNVVAG